MGLYQQYIKNNIQPLRDPDPEARPSAKPTFGNPWKVTKKHMIEGLSQLLL